MIDEFWDLRANIMRRQPDSICVYTVANSGGGQSSKSPRIDAVGEFNIWKYPQFCETFEAPQPPILGEHELKVPQNWGI